MTLRTIYPGLLIITRAADTYSSQFFLLVTHCSQFYSQILLTVLCLLFYSSFLNFIQLYSLFSTYSLLIVSQFNSLLLSVLNLLFTHHFSILFTFTHCSRLTLYSSFLDFVHCLLTVVNFT